MVPAPVSTPQAAERVVFGHTMDAMLERCAKALPESGWAELAKLGVDRHKRMPAYEFNTWVSVVSWLSGKLYPHRSPGDAQYQLGVDFIERYAETFIGRALFAVLRILGPRRILHRMARSFRTGTNFTQTFITEETPTSALVKVATVEPYGRFTHGVLARGLQLAGIKTVQVQLESIVDEVADYRITW